ncbi:MAG: hypothetical protein ABFS86_13065 [Planctomycetota bacterium]
MWWEHLIVAGAVLLSVLWLARRFTRKRSGICDGCGPRRSPSRLQSSIPVLDFDRKS